MKLGDTYDVIIAGQVVAQAKVTEVGNGTVTLVTPLTTTVFATKTDIAPEEVRAPSSDTGTIITGVDRVNAEGEVVSSTGAPTLTGPVASDSNENAQSVVEATTPDGVKETTATEASDGELQGTAAQQ